MPVSTRVDGVVAVITLARPPVNSMDVGMRRDLLAAVQQVLSDPAIHAAVITGGSRAFCAGADIDEFQTGHGLDEPLLSTVLACIEAGGKPFVAAVEGVCLGAGLEIALACHYRLVAERAIFGFPEVKLGLLPGAGTQRLPRAIGVEAALKLILSGQPISAVQAQQQGLVRLAHEGDLLTQAQALAQDAVIKRHCPRVRDLVAALPEGGDKETFFAAQLAALRGTLPAPRLCIEAVRAAVELPFDDGVERELQLFKTLLASPESQGLRHAFFGERAAAKLAGVPANTPVRAVNRVAVLGAGTMGAGIAMCCADAGLPVTLLDLNADSLERALAGIRANYALSVKKGKLTASQLDARMASIQTTTSYADIAQVDLVIEAVFEDMGVKEKVFCILDDILKSGAILASNTSTLDLNRIAAFTRRPQDVVGLHFFSPANVMRLLEVVRGAHTAPEVLATVMAFAKRIRKVGVVAGVCDGFIGNRMLEEYLRQAYLLLEMGATPSQVDRALQAYGMAMGPFAVIDLAGGDIAHAIRARRAIEQPDRPYSKFPDRLYELGRYGQKTGAGFYRYEAGQRGALPAPEVDAMVVAYSQAIGVERRAITDEEIVLRCVLALTNEGAKIVEEGIASRASDVDVVYVHGYGFPAHRGGPMCYADQLGLPQVLAKMAEFRAGYMGQFWEPAPLLQRLAAQGQRLTGP